MRIGWLIDSQAFDAYHDELVDAVIRNGHTAVSASRPPAPYQWDDVGYSYRDAFPPGSCVVTHGDIDLVCRVATDQLWSPGVFASVCRFHCSQYYVHCGQFLLNRNYMMLPFAELPRMANFVFDTFGMDSEIFVRPDSPLKIFSGQRVSQPEFEKDYEFLAFNDFPRESMIVVSSPKRIVSEWRFVVARKQVVTGSLYHNGAEFVALPAEDSNALQLARMIASRDYEPDPVWVIDVCKTATGEYALLEIGGFSFASLYGCDKNAVVKAVSKVAESIHVAVDSFQK